MNIGWTDLPGALLLLAAGLIVVAAFIGFIAWYARRRKSPSVVVEVAGSLARVWVAFTALGLVITAMRWLGGGETWVANVPVVADLVATQTCGDVSAVEATSTTLVCGYFHSADVTVAALDLGTRALLAAGDLLALIAIAVPGAVLAIACGRALKGVFFSRAVSRALLVGAVVVLVAGLGAEISGSLGRSILANELFPAHTGDVVSTGVYRVSASFLPICAAFALAALGAIFSYGTRLQRDTEGLV